ncbi:hypothetical protein LJC56_03575 [Christensenellaceae bacterium OttesenSCG-928-K19]|nr:hypothetical protein [Christensenellaceae bacterium OttesenSCG-928-K19]
MKFIAIDEIIMQTASGCQIAGIDTKMSGKEWRQKEYGAGNGKKRAEFDAQRGKKVL